jgi:hypothetical protein
MDAGNDFRRMAFALNANARDCEAEFAWLAAVLQRRLDNYFGTPPSSPSLPDATLPPPTLKESGSPFADLLIRHELSPTERLILALALAPHFKSQLLDVLWSRNDATQRGFSEFGGIQGGQSGCFLPTGETACFLLAGENLENRLYAMRLLADTQRLVADELIAPLSAPIGDTLMAGLLRPSRRVLATIIGGEEALPEGDEIFPAQRVTTGLEWNELVLPESTLAQIEEVRDWLNHSPTLLGDWGLSKRLRPGYVCLFHGPSGTGKTLTACLLGKLCARDVYRIDLSMVVSKYIGETEKNLARVFALAERRGWILFFDEADALFGQRTRIDSAHDRYANQEVSFLLQRIEDFPGVVILSSNFKRNIDEAFIRRFQSVVAFNMPRAEERLRLWQEALPSAARLDSQLKLHVLAEQHELSGGAIMNVVRYAALQSLVRGDREISAEDLVNGIRRELVKEGRGL